MTLANTKLIRLYWDIGKDISARNLKLMTQFYNEYHDVEFLQSLVAEISLAKPFARKINNPALKGRGMLFW
jgi:hypothetical protein